VDKINKRIFAFLNDAAELEGITVLHSCPQAPSVMPCVSFHVGAFSPAVFADNEGYADNVSVTVDIWETGWEAAEEMADKVRNLFDENGFFTSGYEDNVSFNQFNRRDSAVRVTMKFGGLL